MLPVQVDRIKTANFFFFPLLLNPAEFIGSRKSQEKILKMPKKHGIGPSVKAPTPEKKSLFF